MNEESQYPSIEPELEARIVALVLGEASEFESEELKRLIEKRSELAAFQSQMQSVHGRLEEVGKGEFVEPGEEWKLPSERRNAVLAVIRGEATVQVAVPDVDQSNPRHINKKRRFHWNPAMLTAVLCIAGFFGVLSVQSFSKRHPNDALSLDLDLRGGSDSSFADDTGRVFLQLEESPTLWDDTVDIKASDSALSSLKSTLDFKSPLPSSYYLKDDVQFVPANGSGVLPDNLSLSFSASSAEEQISSPSVVDNFETSTLQAADDLAVIEKYKGFDRYRENHANVPMDTDGSGNSTEWGVVERYGKSLADAPMTAPISGTRFQSATQDGEPSATPGDETSSELSVPQIAAIRLQTEVVDADSLLLGALQDLSEESLLADNSSSPVEAGRRFSESILTNEETKSSGVTQGISNGNTTWLFADIPTPEAEPKDSFYRTRDFSDMATGHVQVQDQAQLGELNAAIPNFSKPQPAQFDDRIQFDSGSERVSGVTDGEVEFDSAGTTISGGGGFGGGISSGGLIVGKPDEAKVSSGKEKEIVEWEMEGIASGDTSGFKSSSLDEKSEHLMKTRGVVVDYFGVSQGNNQSASESTPLSVSGVVTAQPEQKNEQSNESRYTVDLGRLSSRQKQVQDNQRYERREFIARTRSRSTPLYGLSDLSLLGNGLSRSTRRATVQFARPSAGLNEKDAAKEAFSTFSLHVSDVSFKLALAALSRGEWPEKAKVRIEEFANAFDYGDPMPSRKEKVACRVEQSIHPFIQQRNLLRISMRTAAAGRSSNTPLRLTFLLDNSGSMERIDRQQTVRRAFELLAQQLTPNDQVTLISFARQPRLLADQVSGSEAGKLVKLITELPREGGTNIEAALQLAFEKAQEQQTPGAQNRIILLTDGAVNLGDADPENLSRMVASMRTAGIAFDAAGIIADGLNDEVLEALSRKGDGRYYLLDSLDNVDNGFARQIAGALRPSAKNVKVQIEFNPKRVGQYRLLGFEKHILKKEDFRNDKVDAAEMAAAEAGVAMYQIEAKPDGEGDIGSVSVRFRDLSTGQMIENRWPIPYEANAPRPEDATPSLRIATSAALLAAKLRGEALGDSVDLKKLSQLVSGLPEANQQDKRIQQLQLMINQARQLSEK